MAADSMCAGGDEHGEVHKSDDFVSGSAEAEAPALESTSCSLRPEDEEEEALEDEAAAEAEGEEMEELEGEEGEEEWEDEDKEAEGEEATANGEEFEGEEAVEGDRNELEPPEEREEEAEEELEEEFQGEEQEEEELRDGDRVEAEQLGRGEADAQEADAYAEDEEEEWEEEEEEEEEVEPADSEEEDMEPAEGADNWPLPHQSETGQTRQWGANRRQQQLETKGLAAAAKIQQSRNAAISGTKGRPATQKGNQVSKQTEPAENEQWRASVVKQAESPGAERHKTHAQLEAENRQLRVELGQAQFKIGRFGKLREDADEAQRKELLARQREAKALKESELAKDYVNRRESFARNEKAEMMQRIKYLEDIERSIEVRDNSIQEELAEAVFYRQEAAQHVEEAQKLTEKWKAEAVEQQKQVQNQEKRLKQMEDKRSQDKARLRELASLLHAQQAGGALGASNNAGLEPAPLAQKSGPGQSATSRGPQNGKRKGGDNIKDHVPFFEDPIKPVKGSNVTLLLEDESTGFQRQLAALWRCTLRPLLLRGSSSLELEGGSSGAPGRGKGKKSSRGAGATAFDADGAPSSQQQLVLGALLVVIAGMAVAKLAFA